MWRPMLGCAIVLAIPTFLLCLVAVLISSRDVGTSFLVGAMASGIVFVAVLIMFAVDSERWTSNRNGVRSYLLLGGDVSDDEFLLSFDQADRDLALHLRQRLAKFFDVPASKVSSSHDLANYSFERFMPGIYVFVMAGLDERQLPKGKIDAFPKTRLKTVADLVTEAKQLKKKAA